MSRTSRVCVALVATAALGVAAAPAQAAIHVTSSRDTTAPAGVTPKLTFRITGLVRGAQYFMRWTTPGGYNGSCTTLGSSITSKVAVSSLRFTLPDGDYEGGYYQPFCAHRTYTGRVVRRLPAYRSQVVKTFRFTSTGVI